MTEPVGRASVATNSPGWWQREPLRVRLVALFMVLLLAAIAGVSMLALTLLRTTLINETDAQLTKAAQTLVWESVREAGRPNPLVPAQYAVILAAPDGTVVRSESTTGDLPRVPSMQLDAVLATGGEPFTVPSENGVGMWRVTARAVEGRDGGLEGTAAIALPLDTVSATVAQMGGALLVISGGVLLVAAVAAYAMVSSSLRPLRRIEATAAQIAAGDLSQRIAEAPPTTEVGSLGRSLNTMLADLETAFEARLAGEERLQRFVGDASHELRTPLATLRGYAELYRLGGIPQDAVPEVMGRIEDSATRMSSLVADLLALTRLDAAAPPTPEPVAVAPLLGGLASDAGALDAEREITVTVAPDLTVLADRGALTRILTNLVGNAVAYSPTGSPIELDAQPWGAQAAIEVRDHGPGIPAEDTERVFERFARLDPGRSRDEGGSGLGLAIARESARAMGGDVICLPTVGGGATMRLTLPLAPPT